MDPQARSALPARRRPSSPAQDLEQLADAVEVLRLVDEAQKEVVDLFADERSPAEELPVDPVQHRFEKVALPRVFAVKQL